MTRQAEQSLLLHGTLATEARHRERLWRCASLSGLGFVKIGVDLNGHLQDMDVIHPLPTRH